VPILLKATAVKVPTLSLNVGAGWVPPIYDRRDYTRRIPRSRRSWRGLAKARPRGGQKALPPSADLLEFLQSDRNQEQLGSVPPTRRSGSSSTTRTVR
jgi:hypothetical protein